MRKKNIIKQYNKFLQHFLRQNQQFLSQSIRLAKTKHWRSTYIYQPGAVKDLTVTLIPGIGIGPEVCESVLSVFNHVNAPVKFESIENFSWEDEKVRKQLKKNRTILLGVIPGHKSAKFVENFHFYKELGLYADVIPAFSLPGINSRHKNVDVVVIRENNEGEFTGIEHEVYPGVIESIKVITKQGSLKVAEYAFEFAHLSGREKVTAVHKANIMKKADGLFLEACREVSKKYPFIKYEEMIIDNCCMQMVKYPQQFDVMVMPNLYGSIVSNVCAGIIGGAALSAGACVGNDHTLFSQGTRHAGNDIAGMNIVNPTAMLFSSIMMLQHMNLPHFADIISNAINKTLNEGKILTKDVGGNATTTQFTKAIINNIVQ
ncbi:hypothetical protein IMG5_030660 [Ichthyophthirius multifiliis]|uniref:Isopropylmalate dehydrogenase-like domain-containing protein n=1 Tax=Ichthyophthirius multifiliis TaxID=5932 RepID=G0QLH6_ICHMU|nr:hypothetical protein IMG5_030660 [Ichthyophthirius multifiliis]EGR33924.1 hypothetical protein IMG5_030660 [Ichthyophthirius multifiliis]|eukprot:XP_004039228.1 hypothetical protein IMG5_030660 [Ichthyophthirius multifiliis]